MPNIIRHNNIQFDHIQTKELRLHVAQSGMGNKPSLLFLHGFSRILVRLAQTTNGFIGYVSLHRTDTRGINLSDKPETEEAYQLEHLAEDAKQTDRAAQ